METEKKKNGGRRSNAGAKGLQHIKDEQGNPIPVKDFCLMVLDEERQIIRDAINAERAKKGWMLIRQKAADEPFLAKRKEVVPVPKKNVGRKSYGFRRFIIRMTVAERVIAMNAVNAYRVEKGLPLMRLQPGTEKFLEPRKERTAVE